MSWPYVVFAANDQHVNLLNFPLREGLSTPAAPAARSGAAKKVGVLKRGLADSCAAKLDQAQEGGCPEASRLVS
jgi:hypothetical protein